ncbi:MAG: AEC family transporter [Lachnospiraceae bacterium]
MKVGEILLFTINSILPLILLILLGYLLKRKGFFTQEFLKIGNKTVFYVCLPVLLFKNIAEIDDFSKIRFDVVGYVVAIILLLIFIGFVLSLFVKDPKQKGVVHQCVFRSNFALIGVPLSELIGGSEGVQIAAVLSLFSIPLFNVAGVIVLSLYREGKMKMDVKKILKGIVTNPLIIGVFSGLIFAGLKTLLAGTEVINLGNKLTFVSSTLSFISRVATPLALLVLGGQFDFQKMTDYKKPLLLGLAGRNIIAPALGVGLAAVLVNVGVFQFEPGVFAALIAQFGTPVAVASAVMAEEMHNDGQLAGQLVVWTSLISVVSLFVTIAFARACGLL